MKVNFNPPYWLSGSGMVCWAFKKSLPQEFLNELQKAGIKPIEIFGHYFCLVIASHYTDVPAHPDPYQEVILSVLGFKGISVFAVPWTLYLDSEFHVELGREYYSLPKQLDKSMCVRISENLFFAEGKEFTLKGVLPGKACRLICFPISATVSSLVWAATRIFPVVGLISGKQSKVAKIPLTPRLWPSTPAFGTILQISEKDNSETLTVLWTQSWSTLIGSVKTPRDF
jgi:hypothetical protein